MKVAVAIIFALLILSGVAFAQSQQPPADSNPPTKEDTQQPTPPAKEDTQQPASDQRANEIVPFIIQLAPAQKSKEEIEREARERNDKAIIDKKTRFGNAADR